MDNFYRTFIPTAFWLGLAAFVVAVLLVVFSIRFPFGLTQGSANAAVDGRGGLLRGPEST